MEAHDDRSQRAPAPTPQVSAGHTPAESEQQEERTPGLGLLIVLLGWPTVAAFVGGVMWIFKHLTLG